MYLPQIYLQCRQGPTLGSFFPERRVISASPESPCFSSRLLDRRNDFLLSTVHVLRVTESFWTTERSRNSWIFKSFHSVVKRKHSHSKRPREWQWTLRRAAFRETGNWTSLPVASERNWGEGVCICASWVASFPVAAGWRERWHFRLQKKSFPGLFCCCCYFWFFVFVILVFAANLIFCLFVCFKTLLVYTTTWHQYSALPRTNEMTTRPIMVLDGSKRNSLLVCCWFSLYSGLPLSSQISI